MTEYNVYKVNSSTGKRRKIARVYSLEEAEITRQMFIAKGAFGFRFDIERITK